MICPRCDKEGCEELFDEVDIGVGVQRFTYGFECPECGQIGICRSCGKLDIEPHAFWCETQKNSNV